MMGNGNMEFSHGKMGNYKAKKKKKTHEAHGPSLNRNAKGVGNRWTLHVLSGFGLCLTLCDL